jgi:glycogen(starch) synthase
MPLHGVGGLERSVHDLVRHLAARGVEVTVIVPPARVAHRTLADPFASPRIRLRHVPYLTFPLANRRGTTVLDRSSAYLLYGWRAGRLARSLVQRGEIDIVHGFGASVLGYSGRSATAPLVLNPQGLEEFGASGDALPAAKRFAYAPLRAAVRRVARRASAILATDTSLQPVVIRHLRPRAGQLHTIPNGLDLAQVGALAGPADGALIRRRHDIAPGETVLLSVGRLEYNKGFDVLAAALAAAARPEGQLAATGWRWIIVGAGPFRLEIERAVASHGLERHVTLVGRAIDVDLHAWYEAATVFVHPTRYEGSSLVTLEAMAHRRAIIATRAGGLPDKVQPGINGWLVDPDDAPALTKAIEEAVTSPSALSAMGARSREIVEREFAWPALAERHCELYAQLLMSDRARPRG